MLAAVGHPSPEVFDRMTCGSASPEETRDAVRHLLTACPYCCQLAKAARTARAHHPALNYDEVFERLERKVVANLERIEQEKETARQLYAELLEQEAVQGLTQVHSTRRYASLALCELLLKVARDLAAEA